MPKRADIGSVMVIGSGPIRIGQACEFDYSGSQACKALKEEGYRTVLMNSNPATIMTDYDMADRTYIEPLSPEFAVKVIMRESPDALLPTLGGQEGLNIASTLSEEGILEDHGVELIGAKADAIRRAEDRTSFKRAMDNIGVPYLESGAAGSVGEAVEVADRIGYPVVVRPAYTLGGSGGGSAFNREELEEIAERGVNLSRINQVLVEESVEGWKEYELEVMRDLADNVVVICTVENMDPMGVHTGDSITCAPSQTLTDREYQKMRDYSIDIIREIGVETGGSNIQFAVDPDNGRMIVVEMNPRVSRSSALASKATGFPIAKIAAKLAVGLTLDEIPNDITKETPACFEPTIDYTVVKAPRWPFDKLPGADSRLTTQMKSVGETMSIGRTFEEALQKAIRSLEIGRAGLGSDGKSVGLEDMDLEEKLSVPNPERMFYIKHALSEGCSVEEINKLSGIDPWFIAKINNIIEEGNEIRKYESIGKTPRDVLRRAKRHGFSDRQLAYLLGTEESKVRQHRQEKDITPTYKAVDTCAAEFEAETPYYYSTYGDESEVRETEKESIMILGSGPNRIGQGIEFDYCCVQSVFALEEEGYETIMVNSNPETVSTDYDTSDKLYFEPLTAEDILSIIDEENPLGVIVQFGGQTPLNIAEELEKEGVNILGTPPQSIDMSEDRERFGEMIDKLGIKQPEGGTARSYEEALQTAGEIGYPVLVRPSYVLGGRGMEIVYEEEELEEFINEAIEVARDKPILIDEFLEEAIEVEVDAVSDGEMVVIGGMMEHTEEAGVHSGDSACVYPPQSIGREAMEEMRKATCAMAEELNVIGLMNIQFAVKNGEVHVLEVNPRASRTIPYLSKSTGVPLAKRATKVMVGKSLSELGFTEEVKADHVSVKEAVFSFSKLPGVDPVLGPEMKATGEAMGIDSDFGKAYYKAQSSAGMELPDSGNVFISVRNKDIRTVTLIASSLEDLGFEIYATEGTGKKLKNMGVEVEIVPKVSDIERPNILDLIKSDKIDLIINTPVGKGARTDEFEIRSAAVNFNIPYITTLAGATAAVNAIKNIQKGEINVKPIQKYGKKSRGGK
ncbi:carbamoyl phosphate synthase large subunit [candidate division MSBL1 archaeon SCGC-AAA259I09]|uniref:Carbamoyl phosphate synthase large chain n=2 Tax=candidate division MSBL1 TaxID=215777 RepID=A0A133UT59_9EURY|nr:carbamoyl phosphate synthase large subunit [candidate division MSBL1 archaeon SCGC-AAA259I09]KXA99834.1 carbamoyl phosphate synthase large subunit [candidate division MSBL1 archaeon SCGC-AAA259M10]